MQRRMLLIQASLCLRICACWALPWQMLKVHLPCNMLPWQKHEQLHRCCQPG